MAKGEPINVVIRRGRSHDLLGALIRSSWQETPARDASQPSVETQYLYGRQPDAVLHQAQGRSTGDRNELRLWLVADGSSATTRVWVGQVTHHLSKLLEGQRSSARPWWIPTSTMHSDVLSSRTSGTARAWRRMPGWHPSTTTSAQCRCETDFEGFEYFTDGYRVVMWIADGPIALMDTDYVEWDLPPEHAGSRRMTALRGTDTFHLAGAVWILARARLRLVVSSLFRSIEVPFRERSEIAVPRRRRGHGRCSERRRDPKTLRCESVLEGHSARLAEDREQLRTMILTFLPVGLDPEYFTPGASAYLSQGDDDERLNPTMSRYFSDRGMSDVPARWRDENRLRLHATGRRARRPSMSTFISSNEGTPYRFTFFIPVPGLKIDHQGVDWDGLYEKGEIQGYDTDPAHRGPRDDALLHHGQEGQGRG